MSDPKIVQVRKMAYGLWGVFVRGNFISDHTSKREALTAASVARTLEEDSDHE